MFTITPYLARMPRWIASKSAPEVTSSTRPLDRLRFRP